MTRTDQQRKAIEVYCREVAQTMSDAGHHDLRDFLQQQFEIPITQSMVKEFIWRRVQEAMTGIHSTTEISKQDVDAIQQVVSRHLAETFGISVPFPGEEV